MNTPYTIRCKIVAVSMIFWFPCLGVAFGQTQGGPELAVGGALKPKATRPQALPKNATPQPLPNDEITALFAEQVPKIREILERAPSLEVARNYLSVTYTIKSIQTFVPQGLAGFYIGLFGNTHSITRENMRAYIDGYSSVIAVVEEVIKERKSPPINDDFVMTAVGANCERGAFRAGTASIRRNDYKITLENGWPRKFEGVIVGDAIGIGAPGNDVPDMIGSGKIEAGRVKLTFAGCEVTLRRR